MAIARKPSSNRIDSLTQAIERRAEAFISAATPAPEPQEGGKRVPVMVRFAPDLLREVDNAAKLRGVSRSAWIQFTLSRALDHGEG